MSKEPSRTARLTGALLARKGGAAPAVRQHPNPTPTQSGYVNVEAMAADLAAAVAHEPPKALLRETPPPESQPTSETQPTPSQNAANKEVKPRAEPGSKGKVAMTLRLDAERHFKLRLLSAHSKKSSQRLLIDALDQFIATHGANISPKACACAQEIEQADLETDIEAKAEYSPSLSLANKGQDQ